MDSSARKSNKIRDIVRLHQLLKKWKKLANNTTNNNNTGKSINKFLKKTLSFSESTNQEQSTVHVPKGYIAVCVGKELKRFMVPTEYLSHQTFAILLREAEEEFGFQQEGVLKLPCEVKVFEKVLKMMGDKRFSSSPSSSRAELFLDVDDDEDYLGSINVHRDSVACADEKYSPDFGELAPSHQNHPQMMCR